MGDSGSELNAELKQRFELDRRLRDGGPGFSWLARDREHGTHYVLKYFPAAGTAAVEASIRRFERLSEPLHPGLIGPAGWAAGDDRVAVWRPHLDGEDAGALCRAPLDRILATAQRIAEALHAAHERGLVHCALKPGNVILTPRRGACIVDFAPLAAHELPADARALGALLYLWLTGAAPVDGDAVATAARLRESLRPELKVPPQLGRLTVSLLGTPERGEHSMLEVRDLIDDTRLLLTGDRPQALEEQWAEASFAPGPAPERAAEPTQAAPAPHHRRFRVAVAIALVLILAAIVTVVAYLPARVEREPATVVAVAPPPEPAPEPAPRPLSQAELEALLQLREQAQANLDAFIHLQLELDEQRVGDWAKRAFDAAVARAREGDEPFRQQEFETAAAIYAEALEALEQIAATRPQVVAEALERGAQAIDRADSAAAIGAYSLAAAIEPDNEAAATGLERAQVLDEVVALLAEAEAAEAAGDLDGARTRYARIVELDPATRGASEALARVEAVLIEAKFRGAMSRALAALNRNDFDTARAQFQRAQAIRAGTRAVADGLIEVQRRERDYRIQQLQARAEQAVAQERWEAARKHYAEMQALDPNLLVAQAGFERASAREDLDGRLQAFIAEPAEWWSDRGRAAAASLLYDAEATADPGPRLKSQVERLARELALAQRPVEVTLLSDQACEVVVYKVKRLGRFESTRLRLLPGRYTAVGTRDGYRDVRREFLVPAGGEPDPVSLRCEEQVYAGGP